MTDSVTIKLEIDEEYVGGDDDLFKVSLSHPRLHGSLYFYYKEADPSVKNQVLKNLEVSGAKDLENLGEALKELRTSFRQLF